MPLDTRLRRDTPSSLRRGLRRAEQVHMEEFPSGQRGQTVNLLRFASVVRIHPPPPTNVPPAGGAFFIVDSKGGSWKRAGGAFPPPWLFRRKANPSSSSSEQSLLCFGLLFCKRPSARFLAPPLPITNAVLVCDWGFRRGIFLSACALLQGYGPALISPNGDKQGTK